MSGRKKSCPEKFHFDTAPDRIIISTFAEKNGDCIGSLRYQYSLADHQGNTRAVYTDRDGNAELLQEEAYYPFGMRIPSMSKSYSGSSDDRYLYNGKELEGRLAGFHFSDYGARFYDAALGRWHSVNPLAEKGREWSPYTYCFNNPMNLIDPDGKWASLTEDPVLADWGKSGYEWMLEKLSMPYGDIATGENKSSGQGIDGNSIMLSEITISSTVKNVGDSDFDNWLANLYTAYELTNQWLFYLGDQDRTFNNDRVANAFRNSRIAGEARDFWYKKVNSGNPITVGVTNFRGIQRLGGGNFGLTGLWKAGFDPIEQFVGSTHDLEISSDGTNLTYTITNVTSFRSLMYGISPECLNFYNTKQTYIFTEPIDFKRISK